MSSSLVFILMIFAHIIDDYVLQAPCLGNLKQKSWWVSHCDPSEIEKYQNDYRIALYMHACSWSTMIMLPTLFIVGVNPPAGFFGLYYINMFVHGVVDDLKANKKKINLITDQIIHMIQIVVTILVVEYCL